MFLNFSHAESFSRVCAEAAFCCRPIIATRSGGPEEVVADQVTGFLVDVGDIDAMAKKILWFSKNSKHIGIIGENAKRIFEDRFSFAAFKDSIRRVVLGE